jgi:gluconate 2-dehydrogenase gamma chain
LLGQQQRGAHVRKKVTRREVLAAMSAAMAVPVSPLLAPAASRTVPAPGEADSRRPAAATYLFFDAAEARFIEAACERLIPADASGHGALSAGVPGYLDKQLAGVWGMGGQLYRAGPWQPGTPATGQSLIFTPAELFRAALRALRRDLEKHGAPYGVPDGDPDGYPNGDPFDQLSADAQDGYLRSLESGDQDLDGVPSAVFFDMLLTMTVEGFFTDSLHGSTRDKVAWRMRGFPGAYAAVPSGPTSTRSRRQEPVGDTP